MYYFRRVLAYFCTLMILAPFAVSTDTSTLDAKAVCEYSVDPIPWIFRHRATSYASVQSDAGTYGQYRIEVQVHDVIKRAEDELSPGFPKRFLDGCSDGRLVRFLVRGNPEMRSHAYVGNQWGADSDQDHREGRGVVDIIKRLD